MLKIGDRVHYVSHGSPVAASGAQAYERRCRAAIVTELPADVADPQTIGLAVLNPTGLLFDRSVSRDDGDTRVARIGGRGHGISEPFVQLRTGAALCDGRQHDGGTWHPIPDDPAEPT